MRHSDMLPIYILLPAAAILAIVERIVASLL